MRSEIMSEEAYVERRQSARFALKLPASGRVAGQPRMPMRLLDISQHGCRLQTPTNLPAGTSFLLTISGLAGPRRCKVAWSHDRFAGIRFAEPIEPAVLQALLDEHGELTERDSAELKLLSQECAQLATGLQTAETAAQLSTLAQDCDAEATAFDETIYNERMAVINARTEALLKRLSVRDTPPA